MKLSPKAHLRSARVTLANALPSLDACIAAGDEPVQPYGDPLEIELEQQADDIIEQLEIAIASIRDAKAAVGAKRGTPWRFEYWDVIDVDLMREAAE